MVENTQYGNTLSEEELHGPFQWNLADPDTMGNAIVVDLSKSSSLVYRIPSKATQGDNGRELTFALRDGMKKHVIQPTTQIVIEAVDSANKFKYGVAPYDAVNAGRGIVTVPLSEEFFETDGYLYAQLVVTDATSLVSTVPLRMEVANNPFITLVTNADFASPIKDKLDAVTKMITDEVDSWHTTLSVIEADNKALNDAYTSANDKLNLLLTKIAANDFSDFPKLATANTFTGVQTAPDFLTSEGGKLSDWQNFNKDRKITSYGRDTFGLANNVVIVDGNTPEIVSIETDLYVDTSISAHVYFTQALKAGAITQVFTLPSNLAVDSFTSGNGTNAAFMNGIICHIFVRDHTVYIYPYGDVQLADSTGTNQLVVDLRAVWKK